MRYKLKNEVVKVKEKTYSRKSDFFYFDKVIQELNANVLTIEKTMKVRWVLYELEKEEKYK